MQDEAYFERLCADVYGYYGAVRRVDPKKHALVMLRSMGEFWTEAELEAALPTRDGPQEFLSFTDFRRLAKAKWYGGGGEAAAAQAAPNEDGYGNEIHMLAGDISKFEAAFDRVAEFYAGDRGPHRAVPAAVLLNMLTGFEDPMPARVAAHLVSSLRVYNDRATARALLCLLGRREPVRNVA